MALTAEQLAIRKVGGSDVATILGLNPYKTALELYHEKRGTLETIDLSDNLPVEAGTVLEDGIAQLAQLHMTRRWGRPVKLRRANLTIINPKYDWLTIHIDRDVVGQERGVEVKNVGYRSAWGWGPDGSDEIADHYLPQVHTYMLVKNYPVWTVAAYFGGADLRLYEVARDPLWDQLIVSRTKGFWEGVVEGIPPALDPTHPAARAALRRVYPGTNGAIVRATIGDEKYKAVIEEQADIQKRSKALVDSSKAHLAATMKDAAIMEFMDGTQLVRKLTKRKAYAVDATEYMDARFKGPKAAQPAQLEGPDNG